MNLTEKEKQIKHLKTIIESEDKTVWNAHKHNSADKLVEIEPTIETRDYLWKRFNKTGDYYYAVASKLLL